MIGASSDADGKRAVCGKAGPAHSVLAANELCARVNNAGPAGGADIGYGGCLFTKGIAMTINIIANLQALPGKEEQLLTALRAALAPTRAEAGNLRYELYRSEVGPDRFTFVEKFADAAAFALHQGSPHVTALTAAVAGLLQAPPRIEKQIEIDAP